MSTSESISTPDACAYDLPDEAYQDHSGRAIGQTANWGMLVVTLIGLWLAAGAWVVVTPRFVTVFEDFDAQLPTLTRVFISVPPIAVLAGALFLTAGLVGLQFLTRDLRFRLLVILCAFLLVGALIIALIFALFLPMVNLMSSVQ